MKQLGLSHERHRALLDTLTSSLHTIKMSVHIHNSNEERVNDFDYHFGTTHLLSGNVNIDTTQDISRTLEVTMLDPYRRFRWAPDSTSPGSLYSSDFISIGYGVLVESNSLGWGFKMGEKNIMGQRKPGKRKRRDWVHVPIFWGPLSGYESVGAEVTLQAQGKESLALDPHWALQGYTIHKNTRQDDAIKDVMRRIGEERFDLPNMKRRLGNKHVVHPRSEPWKILNGGEEDNQGHAVAGLVHRSGPHPYHLFFDGDGKLAADRLNKEPEFTFDHDWVLENPDITYDPMVFRNNVIVNGGRPEGKSKKKASAQVSLPKHHPLSPWNPKMMRNGKPNFLTLEVDVENLTTDGECADRAYHLLVHHSQVGLNASFNCMPFPMIEELDMVRVRLHDDFDFSFPVKQATIPLTSDQPMTIGHTEPVKAARNLVTGQFPGAAGPGGPGASGGTAAKHNKNKQHA